MRYCKHPLHLCTCTFFLQVVTESEGRLLAAELGTFFVETSVKTAKNVHLAFQTVRLVFFNISTPVDYVVPTVWILQIAQQAAWHRMQTEPPTSDSRQILAHMPPPQLKGRTCTISWITFCLGLNPANLQDLWFLDFLYELSRLRFWSNWHTRRPRLAY